MKISFIAKRQEYAHSTPLMLRLAKILQKQHNHKIEYVVPEQQVLDIRNIAVNADLYLLRPGIELGLTLASILNDQGACLLNSYRASNFVHDKARATYHLARNGLPTPLSFIAGDPSSAMEIFKLKQAIIKPHRGSYGEGVHILHQENVSQTTISKGGIFGQQYIQNNGHDLKVYVIGEQVFALRRKFPASNYKEKLGQVVGVDQQIRKYARRVGQLFGLEIYGVDFIENEHEAYIIDVNYFPGFIGVPRAPELLADYINQVAKGGVYKLEVI